MSHEIAIINGKASMAYVGETPWHGLGQSLEADASIDEWAEAAGLDFELKSCKAANGKVSIPSRKILYRSDTNQGLSVVSNKYHEVQPRQILEFFQRYVGGHAKLETAGALFNGARYWAMAKLEGEINIAGDISHPYLLLSSSCDGSLQTQARLTSIRVVCNNTLSIASEDMAAVSIRHNTRFVADDLGVRLEGLYASLASHSEMLKTLAGIKMPGFAAEAFLRTIFKQQGRETMIGSPKRILELFQGEGKGADQESSKDTAYGLLQSFTQYADWEMGRNQDNRLQSAWLGRAAVMKQSVVSKLLELA